MWSLNISTKSIFELIEPRFQTNAVGFTFTHKESKMTLLYCELGVIPMRKEPSDKSEMISQIIFGETATLLDQNEKWFMVRTNHDQYEGWVDKKQLRQTAPIKHIFTVKSLFAEAIHGYEHKLLPAGSLLPEETEDFMIKYGTTDSNPKYNSSTIEQSAMQFLGTPYLWGGRTFAGIDCSGFTQIIKRLHGKSIRRDAWQQAEEGEVVTFIEEAQTGDLAFFDNTEGRIVHTGIIIRTAQNDIEIIHASGKVRRDALDHQGIFNRETKEYTHQLRIIKRI
jgi:hypothetical protein